MQSPKNPLPQFEQSACGVLGWLFSDTHLPVDPVASHVHLNPDCEVHSAFWHLFLSESNDEQSFALVQEWHSLFTGSAISTPKISLTLS